MFRCGRLGMSGSDFDDEESPFESSSWLWKLALLGIVLFFFILIVVIVFWAYYGGAAQVGGVIFIGPFPLVFGTVPDLPWLFALGIIVFAITIVVSILLSRRS